MFWYKKRWDVFYHSQWKHWLTIFNELSRNTKFLGIKITQLLECWPKLDTIMKYYYEIIYKIVLWNTIMKNIWILKNLQYVYVAPLIPNAYCDLLCSNSILINAFKSNVEATVDKLNLIQIESKIFIKKLI